MLLTMREATEAAWLILKHEFSPNPNSADFRAAVYIASSHEYSDNYIYIEKQIWMYRQSCLPISDPIPNMEAPEPIEAPSPADEPPGDRVESRGFLVSPYIGLCEPSDIIV